MNAAELFVKCLENEGVRYIFGVPGEENEAFLFALQKSTIGFVPVRHEQGGAFIANVYGRLTGRAGVCLSTLGPGASNLITGIADAYLDKSPVVAITGQGSMDRMHHESHQMIDVVAMMQSITKWNSSIKDASVIPEMVRKAFKLAEMEKPGATHIELPEDIAGQIVDASLDVIKSKPFRRPSSDISLLKKAASMIDDTQNVLILAGNGAIRNRASEALCTFSDRYHIPVATTFMGKGAISDRASTSLGAVGLGFRDYIIEAFMDAELIVCIGYDIAEYDPKSWNAGKKKKIIHLDFEPAEVYSEYVPEIEIIGDLADSINGLAQFCNIKKESWFETVRARIQQSIDSYTLDDDSQDFNAPGIINATRSVLADDGLIISDVGSHKMWIARNFRTFVPNGCIISNGLASMGIALPGGIAAKVVDPGRQVISMMGDGGALMNIQELETAKRLGVGYTMVILNDNNYGLIEWKQERNHGSSFGTRLTNPDYVQLAKSFDINGYRPHTIAEYKTILDHTLSNHELSIIEVPINTEVNEELVNTLEEYFANK